MEFKNTSQQEIPQQAADQSREEFGVYVPVLLAGQRLITDKGGLIIKGDRLKGSVESDAHRIAGQKRIPTKCVTRVKLSDDDSRLLNGSVYAVKPVYGHTIDLEKLSLEVHDYESLETLHTEVLEAIQSDDATQDDPHELIIVRRQLAIVKALASLSLRI